MSKAVTTPSISLAEMASAFLKSVFPPPPLAKLKAQAKKEQEKQFDDYLRSNKYVPNQK